MSAQIPQVPVRGRPVRLPFRVLAAVVGIAGVVAVGGTPFLILRGAQVLTVGDTLMLPLGAWFMRLMFDAAVHAKSPAGGECWPFASPRVWNCYLFILLTYWILKP